jgi:hypothetical protein
LIGKKAHGILAPGCICSIYLKSFFNIFENVKKSQIKMLCVYIHVLRAQEVVLLKITFYVAYVKMTKFGTKISLFATCFLSFLHSPQKMSVFHETIHEHIECGYIHANIFS